MSDSVDPAIYEKINHILHHQHREQENIKKRTEAEAESRKIQEELDKVTLNLRGVMNYQMGLMFAKKADKCLADFDEVVKIQRQELVAMHKSIVEEPKLKWMLETAKVNKAKYKGVEEGLPASVFAKSWAQVETRD